MGAEIGEVEDEGGAALMIIAPPVAAEITSSEIVIADPGVRVKEPIM